MRILTWLIRGFIFFTLFAFALNNQHDTIVHWFFGAQWRAPLVIVVLAAFGAGLALGVLAMMPRWWRQRRVSQRQARTPPAPTAAVAEPPPPCRRTSRSRSRRAKGCDAGPLAMDFDLQWLLIGLPIAFAIRVDRIAAGHRSVEARAARSAQGVLPGLEPAAQRAARQGDRRLHRSGAARPRHHRAALCARQPVSPPWRVRARRARAPASAATRRPWRRRPRAGTARAGAGFRQSRPARPRRRGLPRARWHELRHRGQAGAVVAGRARARLAQRGADGAAAWRPAARARTPRAWLTTGASCRCRPATAATRRPPTMRCAGRARSHPTRRGR